MKVAVRADASVEIGSGHVMRCLTLADRMAATLGWQTTFLSRRLPGDLIAATEARGHRVHALPAPDATPDATPDAAPDAAPADGDVYAGWLAVPMAREIAAARAALATAAPDLVIVDHYALDAAWERAVLPDGAACMALDDLAERPHACDLLLDQNFGRAAADYAGLVADGTRCLIGPGHALLRPEFAQARPAALAARAARPVGHLLISMGGMDKDDATGQLCAALAGLPWIGEIRLTIVMGSRAPHLDRVRALADALPTRADVLCDVADMARLMASADIAIGGAGGTAWERACLGLPTLILTVADNQIPAARALAAAGAAAYLGDVRDPSWKSDVPFVMNKVRDAAWRRTMSAIAADLCDGGGCDRVIAEIDALVAGTAQR